MNLFLRKRQQVPRKRSQFDTISLNHYFCQTGGQLDFKVIIPNNNERIQCSPSRCDQSFTLRNATDPSGETSPRPTSCPFRSRRGQGQLVQDGPRICSNQNLSRRQPHCQLLESAKPLHFDMQIHCQSILKRGQNTNGKFDSTSLPGNMRNELSGLP